VLLLKMVRYWRGNIQTGKGFFDSRIPKLWTQYFLSGHETVRVSAARDSWFRLIEDFCTRALTKPEDKLPALSGLAESIAQRSGDRYYAGIWGNDILLGLHWEVEVQELRHPLR
jgi:hypothetical protein